PWTHGQLDHDLAALGEAVDENTVLAVLDVPHSVSGTVTDPQAALARLAPLMPVGARVLLDLVYADFMPTPDYAELVNGNPAAVALGSLSKAYCLLGARVGYALTNAETAARLRASRLPFAMDSLALAAAEAALRDEGQLRRSVEANRQAASHLTAYLADHGVRYVPSAANFLLIDLATWHDPVTAHLAERGARFRDGTRFGLPGWIQVHLIDTSLVEPVIESIRRAVSWDNEAPSATTSTTNVRGYPFP
ncbi:MAG: aminotransferase class I/II-fold pyridoxal phosphate-dependent enzyme, partial [Sciscionella sp.]